MKDAEWGSSLSQNGYEELRSIHLLIAFVSLQTALADVVVAAVVVALLVDVRSSAASMIALVCALLVYVLLSWLPHVAGCL